MGVANGASDRGASRGASAGRETQAGDGALAALGFRSGFARVFAPHAARGLAPARVIAADRLGWTVAGADGEPRHARAAGQLRYRARRGEGMLPVVGDWV